METTEKKNIDADNTVFEIYSSNNVKKVKCDALRDLVPFVQFKKLEKHTWRSVTLWVSFTFLNCTNVTKSRKTPMKELLLVTPP